MELFCFLILPLVIGFTLDLIIGDPYRLPHPIRFFGWMIQQGEILLNRGKMKLLKGAILTILLIAGVYVFFYFMMDALYGNYMLYLPVASILVYYGLANTGLIREGQKVFTVLNEEGLEAGRRQLSNIVGRDTSELSENQVRLAVMETMSENLSDGVVAPMAFYAIGGLPAMMAYKMANTLDSMIGYKSMRYNEFGKFAARFDDLLNYIPARVTALIMSLITLNTRSLRFMYQYGRSHASPNAGYPEAALAGILNCRFGGPHYYHGELVAKPWIGEQERDIQHEEFRKVMWINIGVSLLFLATIITLLLRFESLLV